MDTEELLRRLRREPKPTPWIRSVLLGAATGLAAGTVLAGIMSSASAYLARMVVTPAHRSVEDLEILAVIEDSEGFQVILPVTDDTVIEGTYGLQFNTGEALAQIGEITSLEPKQGTVTRRVLSVRGGDLRRTRYGAISNALHRNPAEAGYDYQDVILQMPVGQAPAWYVPPQKKQAPLAGRNIWAVMVHGRSGTRLDGINALGAAADLGLHSLVVSYRNDGEAPTALDGRSALGLTEWEDIEAAVQYALDNGAEDVLLFGWSMGGAIALQAAHRSPLTTRIRGLVLTGPVVDWVDVLGYQTKSYRIPEPVGRLAQWLISHEAGRRITGLASPVDLKALNWVSRSEQLHTRTLILHTIDDEVVPYQPSRDLAERNSLVSFVPFHRAHHIREWNYDPQRWERAVYDWVTELFALPEPGAA
ncbi:alpha/beta hydrolase family protein [Nesterenkonia ebinurensis]|uniref:alpha/beta hydrolase family protein n=1 Tax=Nesterenkonia ebinurensis TaxID=2608252 RepID=UPI00123DCB34|nr:alpha/beta fold hydrolase [Nesterenkonia ebinurensis]